MHRVLKPLLASLALAACDQFALGTAQVQPSSVPGAEPAPVVDLRPLEGQTYEALVASYPQYGPGRLGVSGSDELRFMAAMVRQAGAWRVSGGGAEALIFAGCSVEGCDRSRALVAIDLAQGSAFVGVVDAAGVSELVRNDRVATLLNLNTPTRAWPDINAPSDAP